jgi:hypothetical protein
MEIIGDNLLNTGGSNIVGVDSWYESFYNGMVYVMTNFLTLLFGGFDYDFFHNAFVSNFLLISRLLSLLFIFGICYSLIRLYQVRQKEAKKLYEVGGVVSDEVEEEVPQGREKWQAIEEKIATGNPSEWRIAILEADIMLDTLIEDRFPVYGDTLGERLKNIEKGDFITLNEAWEAHRVRNAIAHEGVDFSISEREVKRIMALYKAVFTEFNYI